MSSLRLVAALSAMVVLGACASGGASTSATSSTAAAAGTPVAGAIDAATAPFVASKRSKKFYPSACQTVTLIKAEDRVGFASVRDAEKAGFAKDLYSSDCRY